MTVIEAKSLLPGSRIELANSTLPEGVLDYHTMTGVVVRFGESPVLVDYVDADFLRLVERPF